MIYYSDNEWRNKAVALHTNLLLTNRAANRQLHVFKFTAYQHVTTVNPASNNLSIFPTFSFKSEQFPAGNGANSVRQSRVSRPSSHVEKRNGGVSAVCQPCINVQVFNASVRLFFFSAEWTQRVPAAPKPKHPEESPQSPANNHVMIEAGKADAKQWVELLCFCVDFQMKLHFTRDYFQFYSL